jgi:hypothetical protein
MFKEELGSGLCVDVLLPGGHNPHLGKASTTIKTQSLPILVDGRVGM